ncbi:MAG: hypothetical protein JWR58_6411 [Pseudonocardia sp.]|nr:hypothetical protein [Pseudonocardia sp.]
MSTNVRASSTPVALDTEFTAILLQSPTQGGWTYVQMPGSASTSAPAVW